MNCECLSRVTRIDAHFSHPKHGIASILLPRGIVFELFWAHAVLAAGARCARCGGARVDEVLRREIFRCSMSKKKKKRREGRGEGNQKLNKKII